MPNLNYINKSGTQRSISLGTTKHTTAPRHLNIYYGGNTYYVPLTPSGSKTVMYSDLNIYYDNKTYNPSYWQEITSFNDGLQSTATSYGYNSYSGIYGYVLAYNPTVTIVNPNGSNISSCEKIYISYTNYGPSGSYASDTNPYIPVNGKSNGTTYVKYFTQFGWTLYDARMSFTITYHGKTWTTSPTENNGFSAES